jgi:uncharacterized protein YyaL (SSP411 family)
MANRLSVATSPYLLQHADNPVDWYEWGPEAFAAAQERDRPVLLSIGYSACHWCHVMAHESFEDPDIARLMNEWFVNVKVDREERPDVDRIYMDAVQAMTGRGGWPMTVFVTTDGRPFFAGTYYPAVDRPNYPSFRRVMTAINDAWTERRHETEQQADQLTDAVRRSLPPTAEPPGADALEGAYRVLEANFDGENGGFGSAPKFPQAPTLEYLLRIAGSDWAPQAQNMLMVTLQRMAQGGIHDHLGGGFARYAVDATWLVPHFEKMLYDNALLARLYLRAWQVIGVDAFRDVATDTLDYLLRDMLLPEGGFASAEDADSEGVEGKFYVWDREEFHRVADVDAAAAAAFFAVEAGGNFEGSTVLSTPRTIEEVASSLGATAEATDAAVAQAKARLLEHRSHRVRPGLDDKVVTAWNGLALRALAEAGAVLGEQRYVDAAVANAEFVLNELRREDGRLLRSWRRGSAQIPAFCEDYATYAMGLFSLYQTTSDARWYVEARRLTTEMIDLFSVSGVDGFYSTGADADNLVSRPMDLMDNPTPSANALAAEALLHLSLYTGDGDLAELIDGVLRAAGRLLTDYPAAAGHLLAVLHTRTSGPKEVAVVGSPRDPVTQSLVDAVRTRFLPGCVLATDPGDGTAAAEIPLLRGRTPYQGPPLAYVCRGFVCEAPVTETSKLVEALDA